MKEAKRRQTKLNETTGCQRRWAPHREVRRIFDFFSMMICSNPPYRWAASFKPNDFGFLAQIRKLAPRMSHANRRNHSATNPVRLATKLGLFQWQFQIFACQLVRQSIGHYGLGGGTPQYKAGAYGGGSPPRKGGRDSGFSLSAGKREGRSVPGPPGPRGRTDPPTGTPAMALWPHRWADRLAILAKLCVYHTPIDP